MDLDNLANQITIAINEFFITEDPEYSYKIINNCYKKAYKDILKIGFKIVNNFNLDLLTLDLIKSHDYFIFNFRNYYIIINYYNNDFKVILVKTRNEALTYRYGD